MESFATLPAEGLQFHCKSESTRVGSSKPFLESVCFLATRCCRRLWLLRAAFTARLSVCSSLEYCERCEQDEEQWIVRQNQCQQGNSQPLDEGRSADHTCCADARSHPRMEPRLAMFDGGLNAAGVEADAISVTSPRGEVVDASAARRGHGVNCF